MTQPLLFVYGTLHPDRAPHELASDVQRFRLVGEATIYGELREIGGYPALLLDSPRKTSIAGTVFELPDHQALLKKLDDYEGFYPSDPDASLYLRIQVPVMLNDGQQLACWVYVCNQAASG